MFHVIYSSGATDEPFFLIVLPYPPLPFLDPSTSISDESLIWNEPTVCEALGWGFALFRLKPFRV